MLKWPGVAGCSSRVFVLAAFALLVPVASTAQECYLLNIYQPDLIARGRTVGIGSFSVLDTSAERNDEAVVEGLQGLMAERLKEKLLDRDYFSEVVILPENAAGGSQDLVVEGLLGQMREGSRVWRLVGGSGGATLSLDGTIRAPRMADAVVADYHCFRVNAGGIGGVTGGLFGGLLSGKGALEGNIRKFADSLAGILGGRAEKRVKNWRNDHDRDRIDGETEHDDRKWRSKPRAEWDDEDLRDEVASFGVNTNRKNWRRAEVLWLTAPAYDAHKQFDSLVANDALDASLRDAAAPRGFLLDLDPVQQFESSDTVLFAITFQSLLLKRLPFIWSNETFAENTYLVRDDEPTVRIRPTGFEFGMRSYTIKRGVLGGEWASHPVLVAFPAKLPDGSPVVRSPDDVIWLYTQVDGHEVRVRFDVADLAPDSLDQLTVVAGTN